MRRSATVGKRCQNRTQDRRGFGPTIFLQQGASKINRDLQFPCVGALPMRNRQSIGKLFLGDRVSRRRKFHTYASKLGGCPVRVLSRLRHHFIYESRQNRNVAADLVEG